MTILLWIHHDNIIPNGIEYHILPYESGNLCILDVSSLSVMNESKSLWLLLNFLSLSAGLLVEKSEDDQTFTRLQFLEQTMSLFHNEMNIVKSTINFPPLLLYSAAPLGAKESKKVMDTFLKPENGFSEEISKKNALRGIIDSLFHSKDLISPDSHVNDPVQLISSPNFGKRYALFQSLPFGCLTTNGLLFSKLCHSFLEDGFGFEKLSSDLRERLIDDYLTDFENFSYHRFSLQLSQQTINSSSVVNLRNMKREAIQMHAAHIAVWNQRSIDSRKRLRLRIVHDIEVIKETIQKQVADDCRQLLRDLDNTSATSQANSNMMLGESANSYNEFLALKNAIEKLVTSYSTSTQRYIVMSQEKSSNGENDRVFSEELNVLRSEILRSYLILRLQRSLEMGENWLHGFNDLVNNTTNRKESLKSQIQALQSRNLELDRSIDQKKRVTAENYRVLTASLTELRSKQTLELEAKNSEIESLVEAIDRSTRLNEREKAEIADELMEIQQRIQVAQAKALELRQQREEQTNLLHNNLLESEREGHRWFRSAFANQHTLLAEELSLERQLNQRKSEQLAELFALEGEHLRHLDNIRTLGQKETQKLREEHFNKRDQLSKEHEATMTYLRMRNIELEGKLSSNQISSTSKSEEGCQVM